MEIYLSVNLFYRLTLSTGLSFTDGMVLVDMNGRDTPLKVGFVIKVLIFGWVSFLFAILSNIIYYIVHPMAPQVSPEDKMKTYIFGHLVNKESFINLKAYISEQLNKLKTFTVEVLRNLWHFLRSMASSIWQLLRRIHESFINLKAYISGQLRHCLCCKSREDSKKEAGEEEQQEMQPMV